VTKTEEVLEDLTKLTTTLQALSELTDDVHKIACPLVSNPAFTNA